MIREASESKDLVHNNPSEHNGQDHEGEGEGEGQDGEQDEGGDGSQAQAQGGYGNQGYDAANGGGFPNMGFAGGDFNQMQMMMAMQNGSFGGFPMMGTF